MLIFVKEFFPLRINCNNITERWYIAWHTRRGEDNPFSKRERIRIALLVPLLTGSFLLIMWIAREFIKSGIYSENVSSTLNFVSIIIAAFLTYIVHDIYASRHRYTDHFFTRMDKEELTKKVERLEFENKALKSALKQAVAKDLLEEINNEKGNIPF